VVVAEGFTLTLVPVTVPTPLSMLRLASPVAVQESVAEPPAVISAAEAVKLAIAGVPTTVTVAVAVTAVPAALVAVRV